VREDLDRLVSEMVTRGIRFDDACREFERRFIMCALAKTDSLTEAAELIDLHRNSLSRKIASYQIKKPRRS
jgi:DNA-binding NtrC family response regulator